MFLSMSTALIGGVTFSGFSLLCNKGRGSHTRKSQDNQMQIHLFSSGGPNSSTILKNLYTLHAVHFYFGCTMLYLLRLYDILHGTKCKEDEMN